MLINRSRQKTRRGAATVELAILTPFLFFLFLLAIDYARVFYFAVTLQNCARNGAYYASNYPNANYIYNDIYGYKTLDEAVMSDAASMYDPADVSTKPTYTVQYSTSQTGPFTLTTEPAEGFAQCKVQWTFKSLTRFPWIPASVPLTRTSTMRIAPVLPKFATPAPTGGSGS